MKPAVLAALSLSCLLLLCAQAHPDGTSSKCKCSNGFVGRINSKMVKGQPLIHLPSTFCPQIEIIITTTADKEKCVSPQSKLGKLILENWRKQKKNAAVMSSSPASSQRNTTSLQLTSRQQD